MQRILFVGFLLLSLMVCVTSPGWAGGFDDAKAGSAAAAGGNYDEAIRLFTKGIESGELSRENLSITYNNRGVSWYAKGDYDKAIADFTKAIEINPQYALAYYDRGNAWGKKGDYDKAIADYTKAIEINPHYALAYDNRGVAWGKKGDPNKAKADHDKAKEINPPLLTQENLPAIVKKIQPSVVTIRTYDKNGKGLKLGSGFFIRKGGDIITNRHVLEGASSADVKTAQGKVYPVTRVVAEDTEGDLILISVDIPPDAVYPLSVSASIPEVGERVLVIGSPLGLEQTASDGIVSAVREIPQFGKIIQITAPISPGSSGSPVVNMKGEAIGVASLQRAVGQNLNFAVPSERVARLKSGKEQRLAEWEDGRTNELRASAERIYSTGLSFLWMEDFKKALSFFEGAIKKNPRYAEAYFQIGYCNGKLGRYPEAVEAFKQAIRIKPDYAEAHYNLGDALVLLGNEQEAIDHYEQALRINPDFTQARDALARLQAGQ